MVMTPNLLIEDYALALTHIGLVLDSFKNSIPEYPLGLKVRWVETYDSFIKVVIGKICGFDYFQYFDYEPEWYYHITIERSTIVFNDGTTKPCTHNKVDCVAEDQIELID